MKITPNINAEMQRIARYDPRVFDGALRRVMQMAQERGSSSLPGDYVLNVTRDVREEFDRASR